MNPKKTRLNSSVGLLFKLNLLKHPHLKNLPFFLFFHNVLLHFKRSLVLMQKSFKKSYFLKSIIKKQNDL
ncbi:MAG: hypothetical protein BGO88_15490 [Flavobacterium sp. 38-13]|nr:MAG: hypothetical protein BGO88_15490 [Flavobacterium sp. 38-13]